MPFRVAVRQPVRKTAARITALTAVTAALVAATLVAATGPAAAVPRLEPAAAVARLELAAAAPGPGDEGGTAALHKALQQASRGYLDAKAALEKSTKRQRALADRLATIQAELVVRRKAAGEVAEVAYRTSRLGPVSALMGSDSPTEFLDRATTLDAMAASQDERLRALTEAQEQEARAKAAIEAEIREQRKQVALMAKRKQQAERALRVANSTASGGISGSGAPLADPAPRNADGSWPDESCSEDDPTTSGCLTPRTLHALQEAKQAGFTRYVSCYRDGSSGEHPKGRACDFAAEPDGFGGVATGDDRRYGDNLSAFFIRNANRLGVLYVIWYKRIWLPSSGWRSYSGAGGDPSSDHTNHVHLSVY